jgi:hypothetical protein
MRIMLSRIKNISRPAWVVIGVIAALLLVPTAAVAVASNVIVKGGTGPGQAGVTTAHQLLATEASPSTLFTAEAQVGSVSSVFIKPLVIANGSDEVVTQLNVTNSQLTSTGQNEVFVWLFSGTGSTCGGTLLSQALFDLTTNLGSDPYTFPSGIPVPNGDELCVDEHFSIATADVTASGYGLPSGSVG